MSARASLSDTILRTTPPQSLHPPGSLPHPLVRFLESPNPLVCFLEPRMQAPIQTRAPLRILSLPSASTLHFPLPFVVLPRANRLPVRVRCCTGCGGGNGNNPRPPAQQQRRSYPFDEIEPRWQRYWEENRTFRTPDEVDTAKPKCYILDMFPYPR